jgi:hypothetical protein
MHCYLTNSNIIMISCTSVVQATETFAFRQSSTLSKWADVQQSCQVERTHKYLFSICRQSKGRSLILCVFGKEAADLLYQAFRRIVAAFRKFSSSGSHQLTNIRSL